jgi:cytochrome P450
MMHDETIYPEPDKFKPERFMGEDDKSSLAIFGFGRRICPGLHTAQDSLFIMAASVIATFDVSSILDKDKNPIIPEVRYTTGLIR